MKLQKYGLTLERLYEKDIELVRYYRNLPQIQQYMHFRGHISKKMQRKWFESIDNHSNYYFIIHFEGKKIGLVNCKNIDWINNTSESGLFIWDIDYINSPVPLIASLILGEFGFGFLQGEKNSIRVLTGNKKAVDFNRMIGYEPIGTPEKDGLQFFVQTRETFIAKTKKLRKLALSLSNGDPRLYLYVEPHDYNGLAQMFFKYMQMFSFNYEIKKEGGTEIYGFMFDL